MSRQFNWSYGPTAADPDPGKLWCDDCGDEVYSFDGVRICDCGEEDPALSGDGIARRAAVDDLPAWLSACYDEAEALAKAAFGETGTWWRRREAMYLDSGELVPVGHLYEGEPFSGDPEFETDGSRIVVYAEGAPGDDEFAHIAATDPAHRLRDIALKRAILAFATPVRHDYNDDDPWYSCSQAVAPGETEPGSGCFDESRAGKPCDCARGIAARVITRQLGTEFSDRQGYRESWKPEA